MPVEGFAVQVMSQSTPVLNEPEYWGVRNVRTEATSGKRVSISSVYVPSGCYLAYETQERCINNAFWIDLTAVSNASYDLCLSDEACNRPAFGSAYDPAGAQSTRAVVGVNWFMAETYCLWRNARLPSEFEWDYAMTHLSVDTHDLDEWVSTIYTTEYGDVNSVNDKITALQILQQSLSVDVVVKQAIDKQSLRRNENTEILTESLTFRCVHELAE
jgi:hypothetical protein